MMGRRRFLLTSLAGALSAPLAVGAQQEKKVRIGVISTADGPEWEVFRQTLRALGYTEGRNLSFEYRWHGGKVDALPALAAELVSLKVDVIVTSAPRPTRAAKAATSTIPIVFVSVADPVSLGLVESLARPGGNVTGFQTLVLGDGGGIGGKQLELLKTAAPSITRVAVLIVPTNPLHRPFFDDIGPSAAALKLKLQPVEARAADELERAFDAATAERAHAVYVFGDRITFLHRRLVAELALRRRLPSMYLFKPNVEAGGLMSYGPSEPDMLRRAATSVDRILKGTKPGELPVEQPQVFELVINLKTAKALGLTIPSSLLLRADRVIE
jgi:putative tryptophan/tyrosine transport system substrate-binding protein